ncbi:MAG: transposase family protein [Okeania sp. SIO2F4]|uniref:hypothetical protein n=1 Tax=Okeania sp. SIO2F4 TaxID=2607790 RepID=UPI00142CEBE1|nr:hypothetical protein [Okeania sp. SIO2F4]MDJ0517275.1 hypothetical protein [Trichodesmium sp. MO_231.B1]NES05582.1 transposase family protein [Okeania sp. SIO2F4]
MSTSSRPTKKPRGKELTDQQKHLNKEKSSVRGALPQQYRVKCEHTISGVKRYNAARRLYRNHIKDLDYRFMFTAAGLWNFYLMAA